MSFRDTRHQENMPLHWTGLSSPVAARALNQALHSEVDIATSGVSANTRVDTLRGSVAARDLQIGDQVKTRRSGFATLRWIGTSRPNGRQNMPMRRALRGGQHRTVLLTAEQLVLVEHNRGAQLFGTQQVLCRAGHLEIGAQFIPDKKVTPVFVHLLFDAVELVKCGSVWVESLCPDMEHIRAQSHAVADDILTHMPRLTNHQGLAAYVRDLPVLDRRETEALFS